MITVTMKGNCRVTNIARNRKIIYGVWVWLYSKTKKYLKNHYHPAGDSSFMLPTYVIM